MALDFPTNPTDGQIYGNYQYDDANNVWKLLPAPLQQLKNLGDVDVTSPSAGELLAYNAGTNKWENQPPEVSLGLVIALG